MQTRKRPDKSLPYELPLFSQPSEDKDFLYKKERLLRSLRGHKQQYKRYMGSPLRYAGGKSWAVGYIVEHLPGNLDRVVSPFIGGASLEVALAKELGIPVLGFDIFDILVNYWQVQIKYPHDIYAELKKLSPDAETYKRVKHLLKKHWQKEIVLPPVKLAAYYYFNHNLSYGPGFLGWLSSVYAKQEVYDRMIQKVRDFRVTGLWVECANFPEVIEEHIVRISYIAILLIIWGKTVHYLEAYIHSETSLYTMTTSSTKF
jgi:DNA adenine methylase